MLDIKFIRDNKELIKQNCLNRKVKIDIDELLALDEKKREVQTNLELLRAEKNRRTPKGKPADSEIEEIKKINEEIKKMEVELDLASTNFVDLLLKVPNLTHPNSPIGGEDSFKVISTSGKPQEFSFEPKDHETILTSLDLIDFERGAKVAGAKFYFWKNDMVRLNMALINYGLDVVTKHGYIMIETPDLAKNEILRGIGFNPRGAETQVYSLENSDLSLIGTAEITMGGYHANEILDLSNGPKKYVALSHCFRTEAGAYGRESKGLYRVHQFAKLEMFIYCKPEDSEKLHQEILNIEKEIVDGLKIPYRVIDIASGDLGGPAFKKYDIEAWMTMKASAGSNQGDYGEITSTSNCTDYQARRLNIRYKKDDGSNEFTHTLNGTAVVLSRFPVALVENYQQADGTIKVPEVLIKYFGKELIK